MYSHIFPVRLIVCRPFSIAHNLSEILEVGFKFIVVCFLEHCFIDLLLDFSVSGLFPSKRAPDGSRDSR